MKHAISIALLSLSCLLASQGGTSINAPLLGYVYESGSRTLRSVEGLPGASLLGQALRLEMDITDAVVAPDQSYVFALTAESRAARVLILHAGIVVPRDIAGPSRRVDRIALSPSGACAVLYDASEGILQIVTGLPDKPAVTREISRTSVDYMAVSDDGRVLLVASIEPFHPVLLFDELAQPHEIAFAGAVSAMVFRPQSHDALIAGGSRITLVHDVDAGASYREFDDSSGPPLALSFSRQGRRFFAAYGDGTIRTHDLTSGEWSRMICPCVPTGLQLMNGDAVFRLTQSGSGPLFLLDGANNRIVFAVREESPK
jgi:WD40 repeat protein